MYIILPGTPISQIRMRASRIHGFTQMYDPRAKEKNAIKHFLKQHYQDDKIIHPRVSFLFLMPIPKSLHKKTREGYAIGIIKHEKKPDVDNLVKLYLDCLTGICFERDEEVSLGPCIKLYSTTPQTVIFIDSMHESLSSCEIEQPQKDFLTSQGFEI